MMGQLMKPKKTEITGRALTDNQLASPLVDFYSVIITFSLVLVFR